MTDDFTPEETEKLLKGIKIPPRPEVLVSFLGEANKATPNAGKLAEIVQRDAAMAAGLLKCVNSPMFGLRAKIASVPQAVSLLGLRSVRSLIMGLAVRGAFRIDDPQFVERFWDASAVRAGLCGAVARAAKGQDVDTCNTLGLLADCAVPAMIIRFEGYQQFYLDAGAYVGRTITAAERERFGTDHATAGYLLARSWRFPQEIFRAIQLHHDISEASQDLPGAVLVLKVAERVFRSARGLPDEHEWSVLGEAACEILGIDAQLIGELAQQAA